MRGLAVLALLLGLIAVIMPFNPKNNPDTAGENLAVSFGEFRRAAWLFAVEHPTYQGEVPLTALGLPETWANVRHYRVAMQGGIACAYGIATQEEAMDTRARLGNSVAVGYALDGRLLPANVPLLVTVPDGVLVSIMEVTP